VQAEMSSRVWRGRMPSRYIPLYPARTASSRSGRVDTRRNMSGTNGRLVAFLTSSYSSPRRPVAWLSSISGTRTWAVASSILDSPFNSGYGIAGDVAAAQDRDGLGLEVDVGVEALDHALDDQQREQGEGELGSGEQAEPALQVEQASG